MAAINFGAIRFAIAPYVLIQPYEKTSTYIKNKELVNQ